jgi:hypothetical protein
MDHYTYLHLLSLVTPFIDEEDTVMTTHTRINRLGKSGLKAEKELIFVSLPPTKASRTPPHTLGNSSRLGLFTPNLEEIPFVYGFLKYHSSLFENKKRKFARPRSE